LLGRLGYNVVFFHIRMLSCIIDSNKIFHTCLIEKQLDKNNPRFIKHNQNANIIVSFLCARLYDSLQQFQRRYE